MTLENARVLYKHRLDLGKPVDDILHRYPELKEAEATTPTETKKEVKKDGKVRKR